MVVQSTSVIVEIIGVTYIFMPVYVITLLAVFIDVQTVRVAFKALRYP